MLSIPTLGPSRMKPLCFCSTNRPQISAEYPTTLHRLHLNTPCTRSSLLSYSPSLAPLLPLAQSAFAGTMIRPIWLGTLPLPRLLQSRATATNFGRPITDIRVAPLLFLTANYGLLNIGLTITTPNLPPPSGLKSGVARNQLPTKPFAQAFLDGTRVLRIPRAPR